LTQAVDADGHRRFRSGLFRSRSKGTDAMAEDLRMALLEPLRKVQLEEEE
jgi:hypothetical protein